MFEPWRFIDPSFYQAPQIYISIIFVLFAFFHTALHACELWPELLLLFSSMKNVCVLISGTHTHNRHQASVHERIYLLWIDRVGKKAVERKHIGEEQNRLHYQINKYHWICINHPKQVSVDEHENVPIYAAVTFNICLFNKVDFYSIPLETFMLWLLFKSIDYFNWLHHSTDWMAFLHPFASLLFGDDDDHLCIRNRLFFGEHYSKLKCNVKSIEMIPMNFVF